MRILLMMLGAIGSVALFAVGVPMVLIGFAEQGHLDEAYVVGFVPGAGCDDGHELYLDVEDGAVLDCVPSGVTSGSGRVSLPGFTDAQEEELAALAARFGVDGLAPGERQELQSLVDEFAATVPAEKRPYGDEAVSGTGRVWLGGGMIVAALAGTAATFRFGPPPTDHSGRGQGRGPRDPGTSTGRGR